MKSAFFRPPRSIGIKKLSTQKLTVPSPFCFLETFQSSLEGIKLVQSPAELLGCGRGEGLAAGNSAWSRELRLLGSWRLSVGQTRHQKTIQIYRADSLSQFVKKRKKKKKKLISLKKFSSRKISTTFTYVPMWELSSNAETGRPGVISSAGTFFQSERRKNIPFSLNFFLPKSCNLYHLLLLFSWK